MNKDLVIIAPFTGEFDGAASNRFNYLANYLSREGWNVELITSCFSHAKKERRTITESPVDYSLTLIEEPGYKNNISLERISSHRKFAKNLKRYLYSREVPDVVYCAIPSIESAKVAARYAKEKKVKFIIDIQDLWPENFQMIWSLPLISSAIYYPFRRNADFVYAAADEIVAVSETYGERALQVNKKCSSFTKVYLGTMFEEYDSIEEEDPILIKRPEELWLVYIGTLGVSYEIERVIDAVRLTRNKGEKRIKFIIVGDGPLRKRFQEYAAEDMTYVYFTGRLPYKEMAQLLKKSDFAINPIRSGSAASIVNKVADYAAAGLPVINMQDCKEYKEMIDTYKLGMNVEPGSSLEVADCLLELSGNKKKREEMSRNNKAIAKEFFERKNTYVKIKDVLDKPENDELFAFREEMS